MPTPTPGPEATNTMSELEQRLKEIERNFNTASEAASELVEYLARDILKSNPDLHEFVMGMGTWFFVDIDGGLTDSWNPPECAKSLTDFISEWNDVLKITGESMRFTSEGPVIRQW